MARGVAQGRRRRHLSLSPVQEASVPRNLPAGRRSRGNRSHSPSPSTDRLLEGALIMLRSSWPCVVCVVVGSVATSCPAQTPFPMVTHCTPVAVQRGTTADVTVEGQMNFSGVASVLFEEA